MWDTCRVVYALDYFKQFNQNLISLILFKLQEIW